MSNVVIHTEHIVNAMSYSLQKRIILMFVAIHEQPPLNMFYCDHEWCKTTFHIEWQYILNN